MLQGVITVAVCDAELKAAVLHRGSVHRNVLVGETTAVRNGYVSEEQILRFVLVPLGGELDAVIEQGQIDTDVHSLLFLPIDILDDES